MNEQSPNHTNPEDEKIAQRLSEVSEHTHANPQFAAELEGRLRNARLQKRSRFAAALQRVSPVLRLAFLMILLAVALSWSIKTLIPSTQPATQSTPAGTATATPETVSPTATSAAEEGGYDFRGARLYLEVPLPDSPGQAHVYLFKKDEPATEEQARALADRLGIQGEMYTAPGLVYGTTNYVISDGKAFLQVHSDRYFMYTSDLAENNRNTNGTPHENAEVIIREFLQAHGFDFDVRISADELRGGYNVQPLAPDSVPMQYEAFTQTVMRVTLDGKGDVLSINASLMDYDTTPVGEYGIITAQEALQRLLDDNRPVGKMEFFHSPGKPSRDWYRDYPDNRPATIYGNVTSNPSADPDQPALILIDGTAAIGNTSGMENLDYAFVRATGQYLVEAEIRKFRVESWDTNIESVYVMGILHREGDRVILTTDDESGKQYQLIDPPADVPLDTEMNVSEISIDGVMVDGKLDWRFIRYYENVNEMGGGGGGGGVGFYQLNLSGTPVPFNTPTAQPGANQSPIEYVVKENDTAASIALNYGISIAELQKANGLPPNNLIFVGQRLLIPKPGTSSYTVQEGDTLLSIAQHFGITVEELMRINGMTDPTIYVGKIVIVPTTGSSQQRVEDLRGFLSIALHKKTDGTETREYSLTVNQDELVEFYFLEGPQLNELDPYHGLPILISGTIDLNSNRLVVDDYEVPFPDLKFQIMKGTQSSQQLDGQTVVLFTTEDGTSYVEYMASTNQLTNQFVGPQGDTIQQEVLIVPDETFGGTPVVRIYQSSVIQEGAPEIQVQANQILMIDDTNNPGMPGTLTPPNLTIDQIELVYFVSNPYYQVNDPNYDRRSPYIQPVWRFHGRYEDGNEFDVLIQALKQEFLSPELAPGLSPG